MKYSLSRAVTKRTIVKVSLFLLLFVIALVFFANWFIPYKTQAYLYSEINDIPSQRVALVLGTSPKLKGGQPNPFFENRIKAAEELYRTNKVKAFVVSGDNGSEYYNEPEDMKKALVKLGVPDSIIYLDHAGFRTLDSVVRMSKIFGQNSFIIISQRFHNERAIFIAQRNNLTAYGYNADDVPSGRVSYRTMIREKLARVKVLLDILSNKQPKFLGKPIDIKQIANT